MPQQMKIQAVQRNYSVITFILFWSALVIISSLYVTIPLTSVIADFYNVSLTTAATAGSSFSIGFAIGCLVFGTLSEKYGRKRVIVVGLFALTMISVLLGMVNAFSWLVLLRMLQGVAAATFSPVALAYAVEIFPTDRRVTAIGFISTGFLVAGIVGQVISSIMIELGAWQSVFYLLAAVYALTVLVIIRYLPKSETGTDDVRIWGLIRKIPPLFVRKNVVLCFIIAFILLMSFVNMYTVLGSYLSGNGFDLTPQQIIYVRSIGVLGMIVSLLAGKIARKFGVLTVLRYGLLLAICSMTLLSISSHLYVLIGLSVCFVTGIALSVPALITLIGLVSGTSRGIAVSVYTFILFIGTSIAPIISVQLMNAVSFSITFLILAAILSIGLVGALLLRPKIT